MCARSHVFMYVLIILSLSRSHLNIEKTVIEHDVCLLLFFFSLFFFQFRFLIFG